MIDILDALPPRPIPDGLATCPGRCGQLIPASHMACEPCWQALPWDIKQALGTHWQRDDAAYLASQQDALAWYATHSTQPIHELLHAAYLLGRQTANLPELDADAIVAAVVDPRQVSHG